MSRDGRATWFKTLFGIFEEGSYESIQSHFDVDFEAGLLHSKANDKTYQVGKFTTPSLNDLRTAGTAALSSSISSTVHFSYDHVVQGDVLLEHAKYPGAVFQAASQFNCLEFPNWTVTPEHGVTGYSTDPTQGPACALACAAGTVIRNYFVEVSTLAATGTTACGHTSQLGQRQDSQINTLDALEIALNNNQGAFFNIQNGYTFSQGAEPLARLSAVIEGSKQSPPSIINYDELLSRVKIGLHADVGVTFRNRFEVVDISQGLTVTQAYCSAVSCAYSGISSAHWTSLARLVLNAAYEATLWAGVLNALRSPPITDAGTSEQRKTNCFPAPNQTYKNDVFLSFIGGGVFGNEPEWIGEAIGRAIAIMCYHKAPIHVHIAHFRQINDQYVFYIDRAYKRHLAELNTA